MFTGIVEEAGHIATVEENPASIRLHVRSNICANGAKIGDSIAVNGCCLTIVDLRDAGGSRLIAFDLLRETWNRTNLSATQPNSLVNLERALAADGRLHGHFVSGHIDGTGVIDIFERRGADWYLRVKAPAELRRYVVFKGSIALDGISLTVAEVSHDHFAVWIIPHTYEVTALRDRAPGNLVNLEADLLAKYVEKIVSKER